MSSALASKASTPLATLLHTASKTAHPKHVGMSNACPNRRLVFAPNRVGMHLRHLSGSPQDRPQANATASEKTASSKKQGRLSVLDRMGANRTTKIVIIVFLSIYGTMETIFYANAAYRYFSKEEGE